jgi:hypothetical protein
MEQRRLETVGFSVITIRSAEGEMIGYVALGPNKEIGTAVLRLELRVTSGAQLECQRLNTPRATHLMIKGGAVRE